jgi:lysophospholipase L1-like esterase
MRILAVGLSALALGAQAPPPQTAPADPPQLARVRTALEPLGQLINDYGNMHRYAADNAAVAPPEPGERRVVFMGDSITDAWGRNGRGTFFPGMPYINRGISGQVTPQMLLRFYPDVVMLRPKAVVILAGTNDIGGNVGPITLEAIEENLAAMGDLARANNIKVILASVLPVCDYHRPQTEARPPAKILALNKWIVEHSARQHFVYLDYFSAVVDAKGMFRADLTDDGLHPNAAGYELMGPLAEKAIAQALRK